MFCLKHHSIYFLFKNFRFPGVKIILDFVSEEEETELLTAIDEVPWDLSQSGRRKQVKLKPYIDILYP